MIHFHWLNHLQGVGLLEENMKDIYFTIQAVIIILVRNL